MIREGGLGPSRVMMGGGYMNIYGDRWRWPANVRDRGGLGWVSANVG